MRDDFIPDEDTSGDKVGAFAALAFIGLAVLCLMGVLAYIILVRDANSESSFAPTDQTPSSFSGPPPVTKPPTRSMPGVNAANMPAGRKAPAGMQMPPGAPMPVGMKMPPGVQVPPGIRPNLPNAKPAGKNKPADEAKEPVPERHAEAPAKK
jgi:hypothetical protein